ncbi:hypothetical protein BpHYR1_030608 [Brachionus plicatilis]|uniref:Uncharacterized protein n=1 Tax=Brachionus plicatilis TaxID=10195 RepID=A0A3M7Q3U6_BRAPC|nr:hypothetical protein BpHYR1_030608 [Brachionus plicatilis]
MSSSRKAVFDLEFFLCKHTTKISSKVLSLRFSAGPSDFLSFSDFDSSDALGVSLIFSSGSCGSLFMQLVSFSSDLLVFGTLLSLASLKTGAVFLKLILITSSCGLTNSVAS